MAKTLACLLIAALFLMFPCCSSPAALSPAATAISVEINAINPAVSNSFANLLKAAQDIETAEGTGAITTAEADSLETSLSGKFSSWVRATVDAIDPAVPESIKVFFDLQEVQRTPEYEKYTDAATKSYKESQMKDKFNQWVRNRVDEIDPEADDALKKMFEMQHIQQTGKYDEMVTADTHNYKEEQMGAKLNEWVINKVNEIDPTDPNSLKYFFWMQNVQACEKYDKFVTPATHAQKEQTMREKFNEYIENRVNDLDPADPNFLEDLEKLRALQMSDKYDKFVDADSDLHKWKEAQIQAKMDSYVTNLVDNLDPLSPTFPADLAKLIDLQRSDSYIEHCSSATKTYKQNKLKEKLDIPSVPPGLPPTVKHVVYSGADQASVAHDRPIIIVFDREMDPDSIYAATNIAPYVPCDIVPMSEEPFIVVLQPVRPLAGNTAYTITISTAAQSAGGLSLDSPYESAFTTKQSGPAPTIVATDPVDGTVAEIVAQPITITFNQRMLTGSVEAAIRICPAFDYSLYWTEGDTTAVIQSHAPLEMNTLYTVTIGTGALSADGVPLAEKCEIGFIPTLMNVPGVVGSWPEQGRIDIPSNHPVHIVFDRPMNQESVVSLLTVSPGIDYNLTWYEADMVLKIKFTGTIEVDTTYTINVGAGALSSFGLPMPDEYQFSFTTIGDSP